MKKTPTKYEEKARSFDVVLGHELYYINLKRTALATGETQAAATDSDPETFSLAHYHEFERLNEKWRNTDFSKESADSTAIEAKLETLAAKNKSGIKGKPLEQLEKRQKELQKDKERIQDLHKLNVLRGQLHKWKTRVFQHAWKSNLVGLAFSGGGIRSATFNLGILQALAKLGWLKRLDYLSTVSGGGYIGGWLTAMINRECASERANEAQYSGVQDSAVERVEKRIRTRTGRDEQDTVEDSAITFLRRYSNYLTPKTGMLSADTWSAVATYMRNVLLNLTILVAGIGLVLLVPRLLAVAPSMLGDKQPLLLLGLSLLVSLLPAVVLGYNLASMLAQVGQDADTQESHDQGMLLVLFVLPFVVLALLCSIWLPDLHDGHLGVAFLVPLNDKLLAVWPGLPWVFWVGIMYAVMWGIAYAVGAGRAKNRLYHRVWIRMIFAALLAGAIGGLMMWLVADKLALVVENMQPDARRLVQVTIGPPMLLIWVYLLAVMHTGFMGIRLRDGQREWLSRLGAWMMIISIAWLAVFGVALFGPLLFDLFGQYSKLALTSGWLLTTLGGLILGRGQKDSEAPPSPARRLVVAIAPYVFIAGFVIAISTGVNAVLRKSNASSSTYQSEVAPQVMEYNDAIERKDSAREISVLYLNIYAAAQKNPNTLFAWFGLLAAVVLIQGRFIRINEFSLHRFYGNRLTRCYLGASVQNRGDSTQKFTGFNRSDDISLNGLPRGGDEDQLPGRRLFVDRPGPLPIVNTAINLVAGDELAWQQRKAASFSMTPLYCGFEPGTVAEDVTDDQDDRDKKDKTKNKKISRNGYRPTARYAAEPDGLSLGTAMTVSGAAASPNMGYHTTPALAFLLTVFNVRLGRWSGNPRHNKGWTRSGPLFAPWHLACEIFGLTNSKTKYVYLSDGGHFDNLGIYELVKRRCRFIIACDAGADPQLKFEDIGNTIRKCRTDLGVDIRIDLDQIRQREDGLSQWHCAMGEIVYDSNEPGGNRGKILYIKASLTGDEPEDVLNYARVNSSFPHQTTADQFFDEAQFESYRRLGEHVGQEVLARCTTEATNNARINIENAFVRLSQRWHPPLRAAASFTRHSKALSALFERLRQSENLAFLDAQMYPEWRFMQRERPIEVDEAPLPHPETLPLPSDPLELRQGFYFCNSLIQLMEDVYLDLHLESDWSHPDNRGWINLFKHWSWVGMFRVTWAVSAATYGRRFQLFCERHLGLKLGTVAVAGPFPIVDAAAARKLVEQLNEGQSIPGERECRPAIDALVGNTGVTLNYVELSQLLNYLQLVPDDDTSYSLYQLEVRVEAPLLLIDNERRRAKPKRLFHFVFGYALLSGDTVIEVFRVQDHLRKLGLSRSAITDLWKQLDALEMDLKPDLLMSIGGDFTAHSMRSFADLFHSVERERSVGRRG